LHYLVFNTKKPLEFGGFLVLQALHFYRTYANIYRHMKNRFRNKSPEASSIDKEQPLTDDRILEVCSQGIVSLSRQAAERQRAEKTLIIPNTIQLPSYPIHAEATTEQRLDELERNLAVYRNVVRAVSESEYYTRRRIWMGDPIVRELQAEDGHLVREIYIKLSQGNVGYLIEEIHYDDTQESPVDYVVKIKMPASDVEINDLGLDETERPKYSDNYSQWGSHQ
jgi:hypothetical protein